MHTAISFVVEANNLKLDGFKRIWFLHVKGVNSASVILSDMRFQIFFVTRAPIIPATTPNSGGIRPPPTRSIIIENNMRTKPPFLLWMRVAAQIVTASPEKTVTIPDTLKLGISVIAGSPPVMSRKAKLLWWFRLELYRLEVFHQVHGTRHRLLQKCQG